MSFLHVSTSIRSSSQRYIQRHTSTANSVNRCANIALKCNIVTYNCQKCLKHKSFIKYFTVMNSILLYLPLPTNICVNFCYLRSKRIILVPSGWCLCHGESLNTSVFSYLTKVVMLFYVVMVEQKKKSQNIGFLYVTLNTVESSIHSSACKILCNLEGNLWLSDNLISLCSQWTP